MRILVTGASGFVGSRSCSHLQELGHEVIRFAGPSGSLDMTSDVFSIDVADVSTFPEPDAIGILDAMVHCAGIAHRFDRITKEEFERVNVQGVENTIRFASRTGVKKVLLLSSVLVYGHQRTDAPVSEECDTEPSDDYAKSKLAGEKVASKMCRSAGIKLCILRPAPVVGEGSRGNVSRLIRAIDRNRFVWIGDGHNRRSFVYVGDVARAIGHALDLADEASVLNIVGGDITVARLVEIIAARLGKWPLKPMVPWWAAKAAYHGSIIASPVPVIGRYRRTLGTWLAEAVYSGSAFESYYGFASKTPIEEAITREVDHYLRDR